MLSPRRESHMIGKPASCSANRRDWSSQLPSGSIPGAIRVIHIFAPKVIKTDVANFRALVQKLTGKSKRGGSGSKNSKRTGASVLKTTSSMRSSTSSSSSDAAFSSSTDTTANVFSPTAAECSDSSTRCSNSSRSAPFSSSPDSSTTSSEAATVNRFYGLPSSFSPSQPLHQILPAEISAAFFRSQSYTTTRSSDYNNCDESSSSSAMVDPLQSLSGYKDNWSSLQASRSRRCSLNDGSKGTTPEREQSENQAQGGPYSMSTRNVTALNELAFSDIDITTGLISLEPLPEFSLPPTLNNYDIMVSNSIPAVTPDPFLLLNQQQEANVNCRQSVQSLLRGSVSSSFEHF